MCHLGKSHASTRRRRRSRQQVYHDIDHWVSLDKEIATPNLRLLFKGHDKNGWTVRCRVRYVGPLQLHKVVYCRATSTSTQLRDAFRWNNEKCTFRTLLEHFFLKVMTRMVGHLGFVEGHFNFSAN
jgi:hypothetical protein